MKKRMAESIKLKMKRWRREGLFNKRRSPKRAKGITMPKLKKAIFKI
jgi:hypothetical protein